MNKVRLFTIGAAATALSLGACGEKQIAEPKEKDKQEKVCTRETDDRYPIQLPNPNHKPWMNIGGVDFGKQK
ncbi:MAG: hypothetical protein FWE52_01525 [Alphaproteobacteria bacterium]|nr:hypothetical protein [Alphaproteobacteria bacterium]